MWIDDSNNAFCVLPWIHTYNGPDGRATPCCIASKPLMNESGTALNIQTHTLDNIFNSSAYQEIRNRMLSGEQVEHCTTCYIQEKTGQSSRQYSNNLWLRGSYQYLDLNNKITTAKSSPVFGKPLSTDIRFGNLCNLRCQICNPLNSSQLERDAVVSIWNNVRYFRSSERFGGMEWYNAPTLLDEVIEFGSELLEIKLGGGEPTISTAVFSWLESLIVSGQSKSISLTVSTNFTNTNDRFYELIPNFKIANLMLSIDGFGKLNDYLRFPSKWESIEGNTKTIRKLIELHQNIRVSITPVISAYNALSIVELFEWAEEQGFRILAYEVRGVPQIDCNVLPIEARCIAANRMRNFMEKSVANTKNDTINSLCAKLEMPGEATTNQFHEFTNAVDINRGLRFDEYCSEAAAFLCI